MPYRRKKAAILFLGWFAVLIALVNPYISKLIVDKVVIGKDLKILPILVVLGAIVFILSNLTRTLHVYLDKKVKNEIIFSLNKKVFAHLEDLDLNYFWNKNRGEHLYRVRHDINQIADVITFIPFEAATLLVKLFFTIVIIFFLDWKIAVFSILLAPFIYVFPYFISKKIRSVTASLVKSSEDIYKHLIEVFSRSYLIKVFRREKRTTKNYLEKLSANLRLNTQSMGIEAWGRFAGKIINKIAIGLISIYGLYQVVIGNMTLGSLTAIVLYLSKIVNLHGTFSWYFKSVAIGLVSCERVYSILQERPLLMEKKGARGVLFKDANIVFKDIEFAYIKGKPILKDLDFTIKSGSLVAIAGASGCGKTTILNLIIRLFDPWNGKLLIDGHDVEGLTFDSLRGQIGFVPQEPFLWDDTIESNIRYARDDASFEDVREVARICGIDGLMSKLPDGYQSRIGENACKISEGEKQRIAIARALIKRPKILILDEAMSSMDSESEKNIIKNIKGIKEILTTIIVSHRLSTIKDVDLVYFLTRQNGVIVDRFQNLIMGNKEFRDLFSGQRQDTEREEFYVKTKG